MNEDNEREDIALNTEEGPEEDISPELELSRKVAARAGWAPKSEWKHAPEKWEDADKYLERVPEQIQSLKDRFKHAGAAAQRAMDQLQEKARADALEQVRQAAAVGNTQAAYDAAQKATQASQTVDPAVRDWIADHSWFDSDLQARDKAIKVSQYHESLGKSIPECLKAVDDEMSKIAPQYYPTARTPAPENNAPSVQPGNRNPAAARKKGWDTLPSDVRGLYKPIVARMVSQLHGDEKTYRERIAEDYYKENE